MSCSCEDPTSLSNRAFLTSEYDNKVNSFTNSLEFAQHHSEDTREMMGFLEENEKGLLQIVGKLTVSDGSPNTPNVPRESPHLEEDHGVAFHTHPYHSQRKYNPPTTQDVFIFAIFRTFAKKFKKKRRKHIVFSSKYRYVMTDKGVSDTIAGMIPTPSIDQKKYAEQVIEAATKVFKSEMYKTHFFKTFSDSPGLSGVDKCKDNSRVMFFQDEKALDKYINFFEKYGVLIKKHERRSSDTQT